MKFVLRNLKIGDELHGRVEELMEEDELLICFDGDLLRVHNETRRPLKKGDEVSVVVRAIAPLGFQLMPERSELRRKGQLDLNA